MRSNSLKHVLLLVVIIECFALNICVFVWLAFGFWCHILGGGFKHFSPTALALGSSGIVKVSGQNCLRQIRLGPPGGSTKVSPRFSKFRCVSGSLGQKVLWKVPPSLLNKLVSQFLNSFLHFSSTALALVSSWAKTDTFVFLGSLQQMAFATQKFLWSVPVLDIGLTVSCAFWGKWLLLQKRFCGGFRQLFFTFVSQAVAS